MPFSYHLAREVLGFEYYPFVDTTRHVTDPRRYLDHAEVEYLDGYVIEFGLGELVIFVKWKFLWLRLYVGSGNNIWGKEQLNDEV